VRLASWRFACCSIWDERPNAPEHSALLSLGRVGVKRERSAERRAESRGREADSDPAEAGLSDVTTAPGVFAVAVPA
jgi:hypothetical protein